MVSDKKQLLRINKTMLAGVGIITALVAVTIKFGQKLDEIGNTFGNLNVLGKDFQDTLISQNSVTALGLVFKMLLM